MNGKHGAVAAGGVLAVIAGVCARSADDCARVGGRSMGRVASHSADDLARLGVGAGAHTAAHLGEGVGRGAARLGGVPLRTPLLARLPAGEASEAGALLRIRALSELAAADRALLSGGKRWVKLVGDQAGNFVDLAVDAFEDDGEPGEPEGKGSTRAHVATRVQSPRPLELDLEAGPAPALESSIRKHSASVPLVLLGSSSDRCRSLVLPDGKTALVLSIQAFCIVSGVRCPLIACPATGPAHERCLARGRALIEEVLGEAADDELEEIVGQRLLTRLGLLEVPSCISWVKFGYTGPPRAVQMLYNESRWPN